MHIKDRSWAEVHLDHLAHNYETLKRKLAPGCGILAPVKAEAYGHGALEVSRTLADLGASYLAVACLEEAMHLRDNGISLPILIFGYTDPEYTLTLAENQLSQVIYSNHLAAAYSQALAGTGKELTCHIELDSGLGRLGFPCNEAGLAQVQNTLLLPHLVFEGIYTHFSSADTDEAYTRMQLQAFLDGVSFLEDQEKHSFSLKHAAGSSGVLAFGQSHLNLVRPGLALYGINPSAIWKEDGLKPIMSLHSRVMQVREFEAGEFISYGNTYQTKKGQKIAALHIGYADGLPRALSGQMEMLIGDVRVPQIGRICMDICMLDVSTIKNISVGDEVFIFGQKGSQSLCVSEHAEKIGTIPYEILCGISARVPRVYSPLAKG